VLSVVGDITLTPSGAVIRSIYTFRSPANTELTEEDLLHGGDLGVLQEVSPSTDGEETMVNIAEAREYLSTVELEEDLKKLCKNQHELCSFWATLGECDGKCFEAAVHSRLVKLLPYKSRASALQ
jgi:hypothetical protein